MNKEGISTVLGLTAVAVALVSLGVVFKLVLLTAFGVIVLCCAAFSIYFFRDPQRTPPAATDVVVSPCDGKIIAIEETNEPEFVQGRTIKISIFMSVFNVHVNYVPFTGTVDYMRYNRGKYFRADDPKASLHNVSITTGLLTENGKLVFKQITGMVARRLVNYLRIGDTVNTGQKFGIIKFGSRMELFLPTAANPLVNIGERVQAGETIIATFAKD